VTAGEPTPQQRDADARIELTFVIPMYNEAESAREAVERTLGVGRETGRSFEVLAVDDGSTDATPVVLAELRATENGFRWLQLRHNCGQPDATKAGLLKARGAAVAVLDADLQMPPEVVPELLAELERLPPSVAAVFGVTSTGERDDPLRLRAGSALLYFLETRFGRHAIPHGASSFFVMRRDVARRVSGLPFRSGNIGALLAALDLEMGTVHYVKPKSTRTDSRLGLSGHVEEAVASLALTGVFSSFAGAGIALAASAGALARPRRRRLFSVAVAGGLLSSALLVASKLFVRRALDPNGSADLPIVEGGAAYAGNGGRAVSRAQ
jgi:polyisoprenyl-phosphate glycosyltransferase